MYGLFVQKHAEAVSKYCNVQVLCVQPDSNIKDFEIETTEYETLRETIVYYPAKTVNIYQRTLKTFNYIRAFFKGYKLLAKQGYKPDIIHANILTRTAVFAYFLKLCKGIPYVITEHWSRYLPARNSFNGIIRKFVTRVVVKNAAAILPVSKNLAEAMQAHKLFNKNYIIVNNVVDNFFFEEIPEVHRPKKRIIHISCFDEQAKNVKGILRATRELAQRRSDFELILIGTGIDFEDVFNYATMLDFPKGVIHFLGEKTPNEVANWLKNSDFFVLFSNYETAGVVISESLVCGKPVLSTKVGAAPEYINSENGKLIDIGDEKSLLTEMDFLLDNAEKYDSTNIKKTAQEMFSYIYIGKTITNIYINLLNTIS
jgi:glycosyltransferase involved in cell wall biosynthesis